MFKELKTLGERIGNISLLTHFAVAVSSEAGIVSNANLAWLYHLKANEITHLFNLSMTSIQPEYERPICDREVT